MATILDYLRENKDKDFEQLPLNDVDILCINEIGYISFGELLAGHVDLGQEIRFADLIEHYRQHKLTINYDFMLTRERISLLEAVIETERFADLRFSHYINDISQEYEKQFAAMVFRLPEIGHVQIVFRGTDDSLVGWKEDFKLTYMREIPAHRSAIVYLKNYLSLHKGNIVVSGHSKGGNLALYAASHVSWELQSRIAYIYMFDAPGLQESELTLSGYQAIRDRVTVIRPEESIVGVMLYCDVTPQVVKASSFGINQHSVLLWQVSLTGDFLPADKPTDLSRNLEKTFKQWTDELSKQELKALFDTLFDTLMENGITSVNDITFDMESGSKLIAAASAFRSMDNQKKILLSKSAKLFFSAFVEQTRLGKLEKTNFSLLDLDNIRRKFDKGK